MAAAKVVGAVAKAAVVPAPVLQHRREIATPKTGCTTDPGPPRAIDTRRPGGVGLGYAHCLTVHRVGGRFAASD